MGGDGAGVGRQVLSTVGTINSILDHFYNIFIAIGIAIIIINCVRVANMVTEKFDELMQEQQSKYTAWLYQYRKHKVLAGIVISRDDAMTDMEVLGHYHEHSDSPLMSS